MSELTLFEDAEITIAWVWDKTTKQSINIFSVIEMCPKEQPASAAIQSNNNKTVFQKRISGNLTLYITRLFKVNQVEALEFYRGSGNVHSLDIEGKPLQMSSMGRMIQDPPNEIPLLIEANLYPDDQALSNLLPKRPVAQRVCSLLDMNESTYRHIGDKNMKKVSDTIKDVLSINLMKYPEYTGSFLLSMPNPYLRGKAIQLYHEQTAIIVELYLRKGRDLRGGMIEITDERKGGQGFMEKAVISQPYLVIPIPYPPEKLRVRLFSPQGVLLSEKSNYFMNKLQLNMHIAGPTRSINLKGKDGETIDAFEVPTYSSERSIIDAEDEASIHAKLAKADELRLLERLEETNTFVYFPGNNDESKRKAAQVVRKLISETSENCIICDPYLSGSDVVRYATHVRNSGAEIKLLSSANFLTRKSTEGERQGDILYSTIQQLKQQDPTLKITCKVLLGNKKSPLHDRFLLIDEKVYILGSSLNEFGSRATTLFSVPDARKIERQVDSWWEDSPTLDKWIASRRQDGDESE